MESGNHILQPSVAYPEMKRLEKNALYFNTFLDSIYFLKLTFSLGFYFQIGWKYASRYYFQYTLCFKEINSGAYCFSGSFCLLILPILVPGKHWKCFPFLWSHTVLYPVAHLLRGH